MKADIEFALRHEPLVDVLLDLQARGQLPERVTHNDCKLNNVMLDDATGQGVCVIDLDTVMPGLALYDFGDMCRTATCPTAEDERDLSKVEMRMPFESCITHHVSALRFRFPDQGNDFFRLVRRQQVLAQLRLTEQPAQASQDGEMLSHRGRHQQEEQARRNGIDRAVPESPARAVRRP